LVFALAEGAVLQQAMNSSQDLVDEAPDAIKDRVWLFRSQVHARHKKGTVTCLSGQTLKAAIKALVDRHQLLGDDGKPLRLNLSRLRKAFFDRSQRASDGDLVVTANLMGNTPRVASLNYPSMNHAREAEAASFMNTDYLAFMRIADPVEKALGGAPAGIGIPEHKAAIDLLGATPTPVSGCSDTLKGEHAPHDGLTHCDRFVMCLFCSSFVIAGAVEDLWRLFSFQVFAKSELNYLDAALGSEPTGDKVLEDLRDRYRLAIPYIDSFVQRQFVASRVAEARKMTKASLHPFWKHQMTISRRGQPGRAGGWRASYGSRASEDGGLRNG
jgi:hypothetical protein